MRAWVIGGAFHSQFTPTPAREGRQMTATAVQSQTSRQRLAEMMQQLPGFLQRLDDVNAVARFARVAVMEAHLAAAATPALPRLDSVGHAPGADAFDGIRGLDSLPDGVLEWLSALACWHAHPASGSRIMQRVESACEAALTCLEDGLRIMRARDAPALALSWWPGICAGPPGFAITGCA